MRKQTKLVAVLSAAALLAIGASMTSFAATAHWDQEDGEWVYLDKNGDKVTDEWKKSNGQWYYLDSDGYMAKDMIIEYGDNKYYVDESGVKVTNAWVSVDNEDLLDDEDVNTVWYYFDGKGKAYGYGKDEVVVKKVSYGDNQKGYFLFDTNGCMLSGWQKIERDGDDYYYFLGDENEGWARTGWNYLDTDDELHIDKEGNPYAEEKWFYFDTKGKAYTNATKKIGGLWYTFKEDGIMQTNWRFGTPAAPKDATPAGAYYDDENGVGNREKNWVYAYLPDDDDNYWDDQYWFYLDSKGVAYNGDSEDGFVDPDSEEDVSDMAAKVIKNQTYLFGYKGRMLTGLQELDAAVARKGGKDLEAGTYYFTEDEGAAEGQMFKNKKATIDVDGEDMTFYFQKSGAAYENTIISGYVYGTDAWKDVDVNGALVKNYGDGNTYEVITAVTPLYEKGKTEKPVIKAGDLIAINGNGKIKKGGSFTDIDGRKVKMDGYIVKEAKDAE